MSHWFLSGWLLLLGILYVILGEMSMGSDTVQSFIRLAWKHFMRLPPLVQNWGWAGLLIAGIGIGSNGEYLLGLMLLCASSASLALISPRIKLPSSVLTHIVQSVIIVASVCLLMVSFKWTYEVKDNNPWSHLLPRHDYTATVFAGYELPRYDRKELLLYAKADATSRNVVPVPVALYLRIANLQPISSRIVNWQFSFLDSDNDEIPMIEIPERFVFYLSGGHRATFLEPFLADRVRTSAIGGMDSVEGLILFDTPASFSKPPYHLRITLKDLTGRKQSPVIVDKVEENLSPGEFGVRTESEQDDPSTWKIIPFGELK